MKRLAKVVMMAALVGLVGCGEDAPQVPVMTAQEKQALAEKNAKWLAEQQAKQAAYEAQLAKENAEKNIGKQWGVYEYMDDMEDKKNVQLTLAAEQFNGFYDRFPSIKNKNKPQLVIECRANKTLMYVNWRHMATDAGDETLVRFRIGKHKVQKAYWNRSTNYEAVGLWNGKEAIPMVKKMVNEKQFIIELHPEAGDIEKAVFNIEGLEKHIDKVKNACHWN